MTTPPRGQEQLKQSRWSYTFSLVPRRWQLNPKNITARRDSILQSWNKYLFTHCLFIHKLYHGVNQIISQLNEIPYYSHEINVTNNWLVTNLSSRLIERTVEPTLPRNKKNIHHEISIPSYTDVHRETAGLVTSARWVGVPVWTLEPAGRLPRRRRVLLNVFASRLREQLILAQNIWSIWNLQIVRIRNLKKYYRSDYNCARRYLKIRATFSWLALTQWKNLRNPSSGASRKEFRTIRHIS
jgi:hypothetical protein